MKKSFKILSIVFALLCIGSGAFAAWKLHPHSNPLTLPAALFADNSEQGKALLKSADFNTDYAVLSKTFKAQKTVSFCGVASSVMVLRAMDKAITQSDFFTEQASRVRSKLDVMFGGMSLPDLAGLLKAHGAKAIVQHADGVDVTTFRAAVERNLANAGDYLIVNYQREVLEQGKVGHISPLAAYDRDSDRVLILDTASHKYPPTWVPLEALFRAMATIDSATGLMRGYVEVSG